MPPRLAQRIFLDHPAAVGETYLEHFGMALAFAARLIGAGLACLLHAFVPALCRSTGSDQVARLHRDMVTDRRKPGRTPSSPPSAIPTR